MSLWRWEQFLAPVPSVARVTLGEGNTPIIRSRHLGPALGLTNLHFKLEYTNPTGSYKDRFAAVAVSDMLARGCRTCIATSSGNTGAALAGYCAAAGIRCEIAIVEGAPQGKLRQMLAYGAALFRVRGFGIEPTISQRVMDCLQRLSAAPDAALQISAFHYCPTGMTGVYSIAHEMAAQVEVPWDDVFCMAGSGGLALATAVGFEQALAAGSLSQLPRVHCVQPEGNDTIATPLRTGSPTAVPVTCTSKISGLQVPNIIDGQAALDACRRTRGIGYAVSDAAIYETQRRLAAEEGVFAEPAGATAVAGLLEAVRRGEVRPDAQICCVISGSGFKDPAALEAMTAHVDCPLIDVAALEQRACS